MPASSDRGAYRRDRMPPPVPADCLPVSAFPGCVRLVDPPTGDPRYEGGSPYPGGTGGGCRQDRECSRLGENLRRGCPPSPGQRRRQARYPGGAALRCDFAVHPIRTGSAPGGEWASFRPSLQTPLPGPVHPADRSLRQRDAAISDLAGSVRARPIAILLPAYSPLFAGGTPSSTRIPAPSVRCEMDGHLSTAPCRILSHPPRRGRRVRKRIFQGMVPPSRGAVHARGRGAESPPPQRISGRRCI